MVIHLLPFLVWHQSPRISRWAFKKITQFILLLRRKKNIISTISRIVTRPWFNLKRSPVSSSPLLLLKAKARRLFLQFWESESREFSSPSERNWEWNLDCNEKNWKNGKQKKMRRGNWITVAMFLHYRTEFLSLGIKNK